MKYFKIISVKARKQGASGSFEKGCFPPSKLCPCCQAPTTWPEDGLPARAILTYDGTWPARGKERDPSPLTSKVDLKKRKTNYLPLGKYFHKACFELGAISSPGNSRKLTRLNLNVHHTPWHTEVFQRWNLSMFSICCLWFFATVNILEQLSIISGSVTGCPKGQWHYDRLFGLDGRR